MDLQISLQDLFKAVLYLLGAGIGIYLIIVLIKVQNILGNVNSILATNKEAINTAMKDVPGLLENAKQISSDVKDTTDKLKGSVPGIFQDAQEVTHSVKKGTDSLSNAVDSIGAAVSETAAVVKGNVSGYATLLRLVVYVLKIAGKGKLSRK